MTDHMETLYDLDIDAAEQASTPASSSCGPPCRTLTTLLEAVAGAWPLCLSAH